jgi:hypothetical protein
MITPKEAATLVDWPNPSRKHEIGEFVLSASARDLQLFVHSLNMDAMTTDSREWQNRARMALDIRIAEDAAKSAAKLERFTKWLVFLTIALILLTAFLCYDAYTNHHGADFSNYCPTKQR